LGFESDCHWVMTKENCERMGGFIIDTNNRHNVYSQPFIYQSLVSFTPGFFLRLKEFPLEYTKSGLVALVERCWTEPFRDRPTYNYEQVGWFHKTNTPSSQGSMWRTSLASRTTSRFKKGMFVALRNAVVARLPMHHFREKVLNAIIPVRTSSSFSVWELFDVLVRKSRRKTK